MPAQSAIRSAVTSVTTTITVAAGVFAAGHLGELTRIVPFELTNAVLEEEGGLERRVRLAPSHDRPCGSQRGSPAAHGAWHRGALAVVTTKGPFPGAVLNS